MRTEAPVFVRRVAATLVLALCGAASVPAAPAPAPASRPAAGLHVGAARVDVTPEHPVRLCGYAARKGESDGVHQRLYARAVAVSDGAGGPPSVLVAVDATAIPAAVTEEVARRLAAKAGVAREQLVVTCTHTRAAPCVSGALVNMFGEPVPPDQQGRIDRYTRHLTDGVERAALDAVRVRRPANLGLSHGSVGFAANRRRQGGPVDHAVPVLSARGAGGDLRAVVANYACHCTALAADVNRTCGDWAGYAAEELEREHPGAVALVTIGCGADANPNPRGAVGHAEQHGRALAAEVKRLLGGPAHPVTAAPRGQLRRFNLAFDKLPSEAEWRKLAGRPDAVGHNARAQLARLGADGRLPAGVPYVVQTLAFGEDLAMVFLAGEVVADCAVRLKADFDPGRLWVTAYANDVPCYVPSRRVLAEGGYEAEGAMVYYGHPGRLAPAVENDIVRAVHAAVPRPFRAARSLAEFPPPRSVREALASFRVDEGLTVDVAAAEPLVVDPVAIDWGTDGRLWVAEMRDYPTGADENGRPGGRVKVLRDDDGDGRYDRATIFLDGLPFPQGVMAWRKGALVCAAPDVLYAEDADGDGRADVVRKLFSGFSPDNQQWAVNGLSWGLDNRVHGASSVSNDRVRVGDTGRFVDLGGRDFRMDPDAPAFEPAAGRSQFGRTRDDWGNWFGNDNSTPLWHYPVPEQYARRNPHVAPPAVRVAVAAGPDATRLYPTSRTLERFNMPDSANRVTSACGPAVYRDALLGPGYRGNAFYCEPVHNLVQRLVLAPAGVTFAGRRPAGDARSEFLSSTDNWFRPVQVRTGPDGALWVVDMYRFVIEHPRWIAPDRLARLDVRAGADRGRIYRVYPKAARPRAVEDVSKLATADLAARVGGPNGTARDLAHRELYHRQDRAAVAPLEAIALGGGGEPAGRVQALAALAGLGRPSDRVLLGALADPDPRVRRHAAVVAEPRLAATDALAAAVAALAGDPDLTVRHQAALAAGAMSPARAAAVLGRLIDAGGAADPWVRAAIANSAAAAPAEAFEAAARAPAGARGRADLLARLAGLVAATADPARASALLDRLTDDRLGEDEVWRWTTAASALDEFARRGVRAPVPAPLVERARSRLADAAAAAGVRAAAAGLLGREPAREADDLRLLAPLLGPSSPPPLQSAALAACGRMTGPGVAPALGAAWPTLTPTARARAAEVWAGRAGRAAALLAAMEAGTVAPGDLPAGVREKLIALPGEPALRDRAARLLGPAAGPARGSRADAVARAAAAVAPLKGNPAAGAATFARACAACHELNGVGHAVGPDLTALRDRSTPALLAAVVDPNAAVDGRYVAYYVETSDGRALSGLVVDETAAGFTVLQGNGARDAVARSAVRAMRGTRLSLMPEGLEQGLRPQELADLLAYVQSNETPRTVAAAVLDPAAADADRAAALARRPDLAVAVVRELAAGLAAADAAEEYRRVPWLWRAAVDAGRRNDPDEVRRLLDAALPGPDGPLRHWQAVVVGGGVVNGIGLAGADPASRIDEVIGADEPLRRRWGRAVELSFAMADDAAVRPGTRYDALRMVAMAGWERAGPTLRRYLPAGTHPELQMGAVSGLADVPGAGAAEALAAALPGLAPPNRRLAAAGLLRDPGRAAVLVEALLAGRVDVALLTPEEVARLRTHPAADVRARAERLPAR